MAVNYCNPRYPNNTKAAFMETTVIRHIVG